MKKVLFCTLLSVFLFACGSEKPSSNDNQISLRSQLAVLEDSLKTSPKTTLANVDFGVKYADLCISIVDEEPKAKDAAKLLDKAHVIFSSIQLHRRAMETGERLEREYPNYEGRKMLLESLATGFDIHIKPRKTDKVKKYYELILKENPNLSTEDKDSYKKRLANVHLTFDEYIELQMKSLK